MYTPYKPGVGLHTERLQMKLLMSGRVLAQVWLGLAIESVRTRGIPGQSEAFKREQAADFTDVRLTLLLSLLPHLSPSFYFWLLSLS